jgi:hypothetical protein
LAVPSKGRPIQLLHASHTGVRSLGGRGPLVGRPSTSPTNGATFAQSCSNKARMRGEDWLANIRWATLDLSGPYRSVFDTMLPHATQIADPFHLVKLANSKLDECRRRVQNETLGHRGHKDDPLYRARRLLTKAHERLDDRGEEKLLGLLKAGDPRGEVRTAWHAKEVLRSIDGISDPETAAEFVTQLGHDLQDDDCPVEVHQLGRTILRWKDQIAAWHKARFTNAPTEAANNLIKRVKRIAFRLHQLRQLPREGAALRRPPELGPTRHGHTPLKSEEPVYRRFGGTSAPSFEPFTRDAGRPERVAASVLTRAKVALRPGESRGSPRGSSHLAGVVTEWFVDALDAARKLVGRKPLAKVREQHVVGRPLRFTILPGSATSRVRIVTAVCVETHKENSRSLTPLPLRRIHAQALHRP